MFTVWCPAHDHEVLLSERRIVALTHDAGGSDLTWRCWCGQVGTTRIARARPGHHGLPAARETTPRTLVTHSA